MITGRVKELYKLENGKYVVPVVPEDQLKLNKFINQVERFAVNMSTRHVDRLPQDPPQAQTSSVHQPGHPHPSRPPRPRWLSPTDHMDHTTPEPFGAWRPSIAPTSQSSV